MYSYTQHDNRRDNRLVVRHRRKKALHQNDTRLRRSRPSMTMALIVLRWGYCVLPATSSVTLTCCKLLKAATTRTSTALTIVQPWSPRLIAPVYRSPWSNIRQCYDRYHWHHTREACLLALRPVVALVLYVHLRVPCGCCDHRGKWMSFVQIAHYRGSASLRL